MLNKILLTNNNKKKAELTIGLIHNVTNALGSHLDVYVTIQNKTSGKTLQYFLLSKNGVTLYLTSGIFFKDEISISFSTSIKTAHINVLEQQNITIISSSNTKINFTIDSFSVSIRASITK